MSFSISPNFIQPLFLVQSDSNDIQLPRENVILNKAYSKTQPRVKHNTAGHNNEKGG